MLSKRTQTVHLPTVEQMWANAQNIEEKYQLPGFGFGGVDGTFLCFDGKPKYVLKMISKIILMFL